MSTGHFSPAFGLPPFSQKTVNTTTWGATPNTCTITDAYIVSNSFVDAYATGSTPPAGQWSFTVTQGQVVITSNNSEQSTLPITYIVL